MHKAANTAGPGRVGTVWRMECFESVAKKPLEETTSGYSDRRSQNSSGVERRDVYRSELLLGKLDETAGTIDVHRGKVRGTLLDSRSGAEGEPAGVGKQT